MAYVTKYRITFTDQHKVNPAAWKIDFQTDGYDGDIIALQPAASPLTVNFGADSDNSDDKMASLIGTEADITIVITDSAFDKTEFWVTEETAIKVLIYRNGNVYFSGFVKPDFCSYPYTQPPYEFTISASDGIGFLKGIPVALEEEYRTGDLIGIIDLLTTRGLYIAQNNEVKALYLLSSLHRTDLDPLHNEQLSPELFYSDIDTHTFYDIYTALSYVTQSYGLRLITAEGSYWAQRVADMPKNAMPTFYWFNTPDLTPIQISDYELIKELDGPDGLSTADLIFATNDSYITIQAAYKTFTAAIDYVFNGGLLNFDWYHFSSGVFDNWTNLDSHCVVHQIPNSWESNKYSLYIEGYDAGTTYITQKRAVLWGYASMNVHTKVKFYGYNTLKLNFRIYYPDGTLNLIYQQGTSSWNTPGGGTSDGDYTIDKDSNAQDKEINLDLPFWNTPTFGIGIGNPQPMTIEVRVIDPGDANSDTDRPAGITNPGVEVGPISLTFKYNDVIGDTLVIDNPKNYSTTKDLDDFKLIDSDTGVYNLANAIRYPGETSKLDWHSDDQDYDEPEFHITQLRSLMNLSEYPYENMTGTYYSNSISPNHVIKRLADNKLFIIMSDQYEVKTCLHKMKLFEIKDVTITSPTLTVTENLKKGEAFNSL